MREPGRNKGVEEESVKGKTRSDDELLSSQKPDRKKAFKEKSIFRPYQLAASDLPVLTTHYRKKGVEIFINGETPKGRDQITESQNRVQESINTLRNDKLNFAAFFIENWIEGNVAVKNQPYAISGWGASAYKEKYDALSLKLFEAGYLTNKNGKLKKFTSNEELVKFNTFLVEICRELKIEDQIKKHINEYVSKKKALDKKDCGLTREQCRAEIKDIQSQLAPNETVGYLFTNGHSERREHFEALIITKDAVIKPVNWGVGTDLAITRTDFDELTYTPITSFLVSGLGPLDILCPQADKYECGTLSILYLKEMLKNSAEQFNNQTLRFPYYDPSRAKNNKSNFLIPSPQVLRYSQSSLYNQVIVAMLMDSNSVTIEHKGKKYEVKTVKKMLEDSIAIAIKENDLETAERNKQILDQLPTFRVTWMKNYEESKMKRDAMEHNELNRYLVYKTQRMEQIKSNASPSTTAVIFATIEPGSNNKEKVRVEVKKENAAPEKARGNTDEKDVKEGERKGFKM